MSRGAGTSTETLVIGFVMGAVFSVMVVAGACKPEPSPKDKADHECEKAWVAANDGDPDTDPAPVIKEPWCLEHNAVTMTGSTTEDQP